MGFESDCHLLFCLGFLLCVWVVWCLSTPVMPPHRCRSSLVYKASSDRLSVLPPPLHNSISRKANATFLTSSCSCSNHGISSHSLPFAPVVADTPALLFLLQRDREEKEKERRVRAHRAAHPAVKPSAEKASSSTQAAIKNRFSMLAEDTADSAGDESPEQERRTIQKVDSNGTSTSTAVGNSWVSVESNSKKKRTKRR